MTLSKLNRKYGLLPSLRNPVRPKLSFAASEIPIPPTGTLNPWLGRVKNQLSLGACVYFSSTGYLEYLYKRFKNVEVEFSPLFGYYEGRKLDGTLPQDAGSTGETAFKVYHDIGCCLEATDPYDVRDFNREPTGSQLVEAKLYSKNYSEHVLQSVDDIRHAIASGYPVLIGITITESFEEGSWDRDTHIMPAPAGQILGGHEIYIKGYDDNQRLFDLRNSWGPEWGDNGDFWMPYDILEQSYMEARIVHFGKPW